MVKGPVFVVGSPHSGTSIMLKILSNHPSIYAIPGESGIVLTCCDFLNKIFGTSYMCMVFHQKSFSGCRNLTSLIIMD